MNYLSILNQKRPALIASLPGNRLDLAKAAVECGADVVKVHMNVQHRASGLHFGTFEEEKETLQEILSVAKGPCGIVAHDGPAAGRSLCGVLCRVRSQPGGAKPS